MLTRRLFVASGAVTAASYLAGLDRVEARRKPRHTFAPAGLAQGVGTVGITVARTRIVEGWPGPDNTGVPAGTSLTPSGTVTTSSSGQVIDALDITGNVIVNHNNVTVKRCRINATAGDIGCIFPTAPRSGIIIEDCELDGNDETGLMGVFDATGFTVRRCNIHHVGDGLDINGNCDVRDNWFHDLSNPPPDPHSDGIQVNIEAANVSIIHNFIDCETPVLGNAAIITYQPASSGHSNLSIIGNKLRGGGFTLFLPGDPSANTYINYNRIGGGDFGEVTGDPGNCTEFIGNVNDDTGAPI